jgi:hypothetical protein
VNLRHGIAAVLVVALLTLLSPSSARAAWPSNSFDAVPVCTAAGDQLLVHGVSDGAGGTIVVWTDSRGASVDIFVQRLDNAGTPLWTANGVTLCSAAGTQTRPVIVSDGAGGAIIAWQDDRAVGVTGTDIFAQRVNAAGTALWPADGVALCTAADAQTLTNLASERRGSNAIVSDGAGGAIVVWQDNRTIAVTGADIYAQRVSAAGAPMWAANGVALCAVLPAQSDPALVQDGAGGAIAAWVDDRTGTVTDIFAQRVTAAGAVSWLANGTPVAIGIAGSQLDPVLAADGVGGVIIAWEDNRVAATEIYASRLNSTGALAWGPVAICTAMDIQVDPYIMSDGVGGAIIAWDDFRDLLNDVYAQRVSSAGSIQWTANGVAITTILGFEFGAEMIPDGTNGAIISWQDSRGGNDVYARRITGAGIPQWTADGVAVSSAPDAQGGSGIILVPDGAGGGILAWSDNRNVAVDVYAQRIDRYGYVGDAAPLIVSVSDIRND